MGTVLKKWLTLNKPQVQIEGYSSSNDRDIFDVCKLSNYIDKSDLVINLAAVINMQDRTASWLVAHNLNMANNVFTACLNAKIPLIHVSTCEVYGDSSIPIKENFQLNPPNAYALGKAMSDQLCLYMCNKGLNARIVRPFNIYGVTKTSNDFLIHKTFSLMKNNTPIQIFGDGLDTRDYIYEDDIAIGIWEAKKFTSGSVTNLCTDKATTVNEIIECIAKISGMLPTIKYTAYPITHNRLLNQVGDCSKIKSMMSWNPISMLVGIKRTIEAWN